MHQIENEIILDKESPLFSAKADKGDFQLEISSDLDLYIYFCANALGVITSSINKARLSLSLLDVEKLASISTEDQSTSAYIEMLIENSIIRVQSIYDRVLIFTNRVFNLGISNESINHNLLVTNEHVKKYSLEEKLKSINKACSEYRFVRNTVIHHDRYSEEQLDQLTLMLNAEHLSQEAGKGSIIKPEELKIITEAYLGAKREELSKYLDNIEGKLFDFYETVLPVYKHQKDRLRTK